MGTHDIRSFLREKMQEPGATQAKISRFTGASTGTINNILNGFGPVREDIRVRIALAYGKPPTYFLDDFTVSESQGPYLTTKEQQLLDAFRQLDPGRQQMAVEMIEAWALSGPQGIGGREGGRNTAAKNLKSHGEAG